MREHVLLDRLAGLAQLLPVGQLGDDACALGADRVGRVAEVRAQLRVRELDAAPRPGKLVTSRRGSRRDGSARTREPRRDSPPPICSRHEPSTAVQTSAPVASIASHLSASIALDVSAFLSANVPPKPQHSSASRELDELEPADVARAVAAARRRRASRGASGTSGGRRRGPGTRRRRPRHRACCDEQLGELEDTFVMRQSSSRTVPTQDDDGETTAS